MKKLVIASLFVSWAALSSILTAGLVFSQKNQPNVFSKAGQENIDSFLKNQEQEIRESFNQQVLAAVSLTPEEVSKHSSAFDCWMIIKGKVFDVTSYVYNHPGGPETMVSYCGKDATTAFDTKGKNRPHSQEAENILMNYYLGDIGQQIGSSHSGISQNNVSQPVVKRSSSSGSFQPFQSKPQAQQQVSQQTTQQQTQQQTTQRQTSGTKLSLTEVATHNSQNDCWTIVNSKVYNITSYIPRHPGGVGTILPYCGKDGAQALAGHSQNANNILASFYVGDLDGQVVQQNNQQVNPKKQKNPKEEDEEEEED